MPHFAALIMPLLAGALLTACYPVNGTVPVATQHNSYVIRTVEVEPRVQTVNVPTVEQSAPSSVSARVDVMIRKGPGKSYQGCGYLPKGRSADLIDCQGDWCKIRYNGEEGWSHSRYLTFHGSTIQSSVPVQQVVEPGYRVNYVAPVQSPVQSQPTICGPNTVYCVWRPTGYQQAGYQPMYYHPTGQSAPIVYWSTRPALPQAGWWERY